MFQNILLAAFRQHESLTQLIWDAFVTDFHKYLSSCIFRIKWGGKKKKRNLITRLTVLLRKNLPEHSHLNKQIMVLLSSGKSQFTVSLLNSHSNSFKKKIFMTLKDIKKGK